MKDNYGGNKVRDNKCWNCLQPAQRRTKVWTQSGTGSWIKVKVCKKCSPDFQMKVK